MASVPITKVWADGEIVLTADLNSNFQNLYNDYNGNITDYNIAANAAIQAAKGENGGFVTLANSAEQAVSGPLKVLLPRFGLLSGNMETIASAATIAVDNVTLIKRVTGNTGINTITGGVEGQRIILVCGDTAGSVTLTHTATDTANKIHLKGRANKTLGTTSTTDLDNITLYCTKLGGLWANLQWVEI